MACIRLGTLWSQTEILLATEQSGGPQNDPRFANVTFSSGSEILPGWQLRVNLAADGKVYDLPLEDATDDKRGYAAITDERGIIRQGKAIACEL